ncbi:hypothetical protein [Haliangium sp.]|uniref:hypothetical protein n=1 Tax=Haliangium sp. TaxID=2663208 RepID=UPI003D0DF958
MAGADAVAEGIAQRRTSFSLYFERPVEEVRAALEAQLQVEDDLLRLLDSTRAASKTYPELLEYFEREVALLSGIPPCGIRAYVRKLADDRL